MVFFRGDVRSDSQETEPQVQEWVCEHALEDYQGGTARERSNLLLEFKKSKSQAFTCE